MISLPSWKFPSIVAQLCGGKLGFFLLYCAAHKFVQQAYQKNHQWEETEIITCWRIVWMFTFISVVPVKGGIFGSLSAETHCASRAACSAGSSASALHAHQTPAPLAAPQGPLPHHERLLLQHDHVYSLLFLGACKLQHRPPHFHYLPFFHSRFQVRRYLQLLPCFHRPPRAQTTRIVFWNISITVISDIRVSISENFH